VQRREARVTMQMDINRLHAHLKWVRGEAVEVQRRATGGYTAEMT